MLVFVNTRSQAEFVFQELWRLNEDALPIALHHGSLAANIRLDTERRLKSGELKAVGRTADRIEGISDEDQRHLFTEFFRSTNPVATAPSWTRAGRRRLRAPVR